MNIEAIIFDLDGVIVSTDECHYLAWKKMADEENIYFDKEINNRLRGVSRMESLEIVLEKSEKEYTEDEKTALATRKNGYYVEFISSLSPDAILPGVTETLEKLRDKGLKLAIGSSSKNTPLILERIGMDNYFDAVSDGNNITNSKPDPEVFVKAAEFLGIDPAVCAIVEDADAGIEAGKRAEMTTFAVGSATGGDYKLESIKELIRYV